MKALRSTSCTVALLIAGGLTGCSGGGGDRVAVRVGRSSVTERDVARRISTIAPEHVVPDPPHYNRCIARLAAQVPQSIAGQLEDECRQQYRQLRQQALGFLISAQWLIGEAAEQGLRLPGGELAMKAQAAEAKLDRDLKGGEAKITRAQVMAYYEQNLAHFERPQRRYIDIVERLPSKAAARRALSEIVRTGSMARVALHESFEETDIAEAEPTKRAILRAIFAAKPHTLVGPLPLNEKWCFFEVTRIIPRVVKPLAQLQGTIEQQLAAERQRRTRARFIAAWRRKWIARTNCSPGYVVQKCRQYHGPRAPEDPRAFN